MCHVQQVSQVENDSADDMWIFLVEHGAQILQQICRTFNKHVAVGKPSGLQRHPNTGNSNSSSVAKAQKSSKKIQLEVLIKYCGSE